MDSLFENSYTRDKRFFKKLSSYLVFKSAFIKIILALFWIDFIFSTILYLPEKDYETFGVSAGLLLFGYLFTLILRNARARQMYVVQNELCDGEEFSVNVVLYDDYMEVCSSTGEVIKVSYQRIRRVKVLKKMTLIFTKAGLVYTLKNDAFTKGQHYECVEFLRNKRIKVK